MALTQKEFLTCVSRGETSPEVVAFAKTLLEKVAAPTPTQIQNEKLCAVILKGIKPNTVYFARDIARALNISTQKASALCKILVGFNKFTAADYKIKGLGVFKGYSLIVEAEPEVAPEVEQEVQSE